MSNRAIGKINETLLITTGCILSIVIILGLIIAFQLPRKWEAIYFLLSQLVVVSVLIVYKMWKFIIYACNNETKYTNYKWRKDRMKTYIFRQNYEVGYERTIVSADRQEEAVAMAKKLFETGFAYEGVDASGDAVGEPILEQIK
jgi:hypothetical protein